jgi:hypothetical protein
MQTSKWRLGTEWVGEREWIGEGREEKGKGGERRKERMD